jgi:purine-nucleoside/S-methyl-5'-thioadenosine phosphorylase / adenosine deaminase
VTLAWQTRQGVPLLLAQGTGAVIAFTGRRGGVSGGSFASLNLGFATEDDPASVAENRRRALAAAGADAARAVSLRQRHGAVVVETGSGASGGYLDASRSWPEGDALVTAERGLPLVAHGADCLTAALVAPGGARLAVVHAGWRGLVAGVLEAAGERVGPGFTAAVGPGAGSCCYRVGDDVARQLRERFGDEVVSGGTADLAGCARLALERAGAAEVTVAGLCTICDPEGFHSHRRDGAGSGRQAVIAYLEGEPA